MGALVVSRVAFGLNWLLRPTPAPAGPTTIRR